MAAKQRSQWGAVEVAAHAMQATSLSELTLPEVKRMAALILDERRGAPETDASAAAEPNLRELSDADFNVNLAKALKLQR